MAMNTDESAQFIANIMENIHRYGFPEKKVALPLDKMVATAQDKGLNLELILEFLAAKDIMHTKTDSKVIFWKRSATTEDTKSTPKNGDQDDPFATLFGDDLNVLDAVNRIDFKNLPDIDMSSLIGQASQSIQNLGSEQFANLKKTFDGLNSSERDALMKRFKDMGFIK
jgi:hypothetical protein